MPPKSPTLSSSPDRPEMYKVISPGIAASILALGDCRESGTGAPCRIGSCLFHNQPPIPINSKATRAIESEKRLQPRQFLMKTTATAAATSTIRPVKNSELPT